MIDTTRIRTGFDVEMGLGAGWFRTALQALADAGRLVPDDAPPPFGPDSVVVITSVEILFGGERDLSIAATIDEVPITLLASLFLGEGEDGTELVIDFDLPGVSTTVPFDALDDVVGVPTLVKVAGDGRFHPAFAVLANLDIQASPQSEEPLPEGEHVPRGEAGLAQSFLPAGKDLVVGIGRDSFPRFANDVWHTELRAEDGSHPLPDDEDPKGSWTAVRLDPQHGRLRLTLLGKVPIDVFPDAKVTVTVDLEPRLEHGGITCDASGFAAAGTARTAERFVPRRASLLRREAIPIGGGGLRVELVYGTTDPEAEEETQVEVRLPLAEVLERAEQSALRPPLKLRFMPADADVTLLDSRVPSVCLRATNVRRRETVVTNIRFSTGLELPMAEAVRLQDAGAIVVQLLQLIHPSNANPYFRSFADGNTENNFESLPRF